MSQVTAEELARRWLGSFEGDPDGFRETLHPDIAWFPFEDNHSPSHGIDGALRIRSHWLDSWDEMRADVEEVVGDNESVIATVHVVAQGKTSGAKVDGHLYLHFKVRDGKIAYVYEHQDRAEALEALRQPH
jgi:ketosteroid isomerase-like protein